MLSSHPENRNGRPIGSVVDTPGWQYAVASGILGWVLDAFDFFVVIFLVDLLAAHFRVE